MKQLLAPRRWYDLVPDRAHAILTRGYGRFSKDDPIPDDTYATAAATEDGALAMAYLPTIRTVTIDMSKLSGPAVARWFDPSSSAVAVIGDFPNSGTRTFTPPGNNQDGDGDWVLLLETY